MTGCFCPSGEQRWEQVPLGSLNLSEQAASRVEPREVRGVSIDAMQFGGGKVKKGTAVGCSTHRTGTSTCTKGGGITKSFVPALLGSEYSPSLLRLAHCSKVCGASHRYEILANIQSSSALYSSRWLSILTLTTSSLGQKQKQQQKKNQQPPGQSLRLGRRGGYDAGWSAVIEIPGLEKHLQASLASIPRISVT